MTYLCRFNQRNRLIEVPSTSEYYNQQNGISHEHLKQLISKNNAFCFHNFLSFLYSSRISNTKININFSNLE